jgi:hypothetical protein
MVGGNRVLTSQPRTRHTDCLHVFQMECAQRKLEALSSSALRQILQVRLTLSLILTLDPKPCWKANRGARHARTHTHTRSPGPS